MTSLIITLGQGKGTWAYLNKLIDCEPWEQVLVVTEEFGLSFTASKPITFLVVNEAEQMLPQMVEGIKRQLDGKVADLEVSLNLVSGSGKMHMAAIAAIIRCGLGFRLVALTPEGMVEV